MKRKRSFHRGLLVICLAVGAVFLSAALPAASAEGLAEGDPIDLVISLDTSGTMRGLIDAARISLWEIVNDLATMEPPPQLRVAILTYGNQKGSRENGWVNIETDLTADLDLVSERLFSLKSRGAHEYVGRVIQIAVEDLTWSESESALKLLFIAGNEPADQDGDVGFREMSEAAREQGILLNAIYCGQPNKEDANTWKEMAELAAGQFAAIDHNARALVLPTSYDREIGELGALLNETYIPLGREGKADKKTRSRQDQNALSLGTAVAAARAQTKGSSLYVSDFDLVDAVRLGRVDLHELDDSVLPRSMRGLSVDERLIFVQDMQGIRDELHQRIATLAAERRAVVAERIESRGASDPLTFDLAVRQTIRTIAEERGFRFLQ